MPEPIVTANPTVPDGTSKPPAPGSLLAELRSRAAQQQRARTIDLPVGGYFEDRLVVRYRALGVAYLERFTDMAGNLRSTDMLIDLMVEACLGIYMRDEDGQLVALDVGFDNGFAQLIGFEYPEGVDELTPREVVSATFGGEAFRTANHANQLLDWMTEGQLVGEASAATS